MNKSDPFSIETQILYILVLKTSPQVLKSRATSLSYIKTISISVLYLQGCADCLRVNSISTAGLAGLGWDLKLMAVMFSSFGQLRLKVNRQSGARLYEQRKSTDSIKQLLTLSHWSQIGPVCSCTFDMTHSHSILIFF